MGTHERIASAVASGTDQSALIALGWASRKTPQGVAMLRGLVSGDETAATAVAQLRVQRILSRMGVRKGPGFAERVAQTAVQLWLHPHCTVCDGHGYERISGTPTLSDRSCYSCKGTGVARAPRIAGESFDRKPWSGVLAEVLSYLDDQQQQAQHLIRKALT